MTGDPVEENRRLLLRQAGGYLRNVIREPHVTCRVCGTPVDGYERCHPCHARADIAGLADLVVPLVYGIERTQSAILLRHYKDDLSSAARDQYSQVVRRLLYVGLMLHEKCIEKRIGQRITARVAVPSLNRRPGVHPFVAITRAMSAIDDRLTLIPAPSATSDRIVSGSQFTVICKRRLTAKHILVLDDTWTTGSRAQSAALALREAGAKNISVVVVGRWLSPGFGNNAAFVKARLHCDYDPGICPVTGGDCV